jgi:hypothetical protein
MPVMENFKGALMRTKGTGADIFSAIPSFGTQFDYGTFGYQYRWVTFFLNPRQR